MKLLNKVKQFKLNIITSFVAVAIISVHICSQASSNCELFHSSPSIVSKKARIAKPRIGLETETALLNPNGQILRVPSHADRARIEQAMLEFWQKRFGGEIETSGNGITYLDYDPNKAGEFRVDSDWASHLRNADGFEIVTPPLEPRDLDTFIRDYDAFLEKNSLGPGIKTSQQFNVDLRELIPGFSLKDRPSAKLGVSYEAIKSTNITKVVDLILFLETHVMEIYAALAPKRLGDVVNYFQVPLIFEQPELLRELASMPESERTYENVRDVFSKYHDLEKRLCEFGDRALWKYRSFNILKFFYPTENITWVYPKIEIRIPDTAASGTELRRQVNLVYALFQKGHLIKTTVDAIDDHYEKYQIFFTSQRGQLPWRTLIRLLNQDLVAQIHTPTFSDRYRNFLKSLKLVQKHYPPYSAAETSSFVPRSHMVYNMIGERKKISYAGKIIEIPTLHLPAYFPQGVSFGLEFEYKSDRRSLLQEIEAIPFLENRITEEEATGNLEVRTLPTENLTELVSQIQYMRELLGDDLRSIHLHLRVSDSLYEKVSPQRLNAWLAQMSDWIVALRSNYRQGKYAFHTRTQNRMMVDHPNAWIADDKQEYRGTMRIFHIEDKIDIEIRGMMNGVYVQNKFEADQLLVATLVLLTGLGNPDLIADHQAGRRIVESIDPTMTLKDTMETFASGLGKSLQNLPHSIESLEESLRAPDLMLLPLVGFEYSPLLSGHDAQRIRDATLKWKHEVWDILGDTNKSIIEAKKAFLESLQTWTRGSGLEQALFDSLLGGFAPQASWSQRELPTPRLRTNYLRKMLALQRDERTRNEIALIILTWFKKDPGSFEGSALNLSEHEREQIVKTLMAYEDAKSIQNIANKLSVSIDSVSKRSDSLTTNLEALLETRLRPTEPKLGLETPASPPPSAQTRTRWTRQDFNEFVEIYTKSVNRIDSNSVQSWATDAETKLKRFATKSEAAEAIRLISLSTSSDPKRCISTWSAQNTFSAIVQLINRMDLSTQERTIAAAPWVTYGIKHIDRTNSRFSGYEARQHNRKTLNSLKSILTRDNVLNSPRLHSEFERHRIELP